MLRLDLYFSRKIKVKQGQGSGKSPFPCPRINCDFYLPSLSGKASLFGSSMVSPLPLALFSSSTDTAAAVNTPAMPASMPPINVHLPLIFYSFCSYEMTEGGEFPPSACRPCGLVVPVVFDDLQYSDGYWYPSQWVHMPSIVFSNAGCAAFC